MKAQGNILKMSSELGPPVQYYLPIGDQSLGLNQFIGKSITLSFDGLINCIATGEPIKKSYNSGYSYKAFISLARCDICIVKPELCHYHKGTCREPEWGEKHCMKPHVLYLANTSGPKIGITRKSQVPTRWIDQGAIQALPLLEVESRYVSGVLEKEIKKDIKDVTNWRQMLRADNAAIDLELLKEQIFEDYAHLIDDMNGEEIESELVEIEYPVESFPEKIKSLGFDKNPNIAGTLLGIKGQYLILDTGVLNIRKHQGYYIQLEIN